MTKINGKFQYTCIRQLNQSFIVERAVIHVVLYFIYSYALNAEIHFDIISMSQIIRIA